MWAFDMPSRASFKRQIILTFVVGFSLLIAAFAAYLIQTEKENFRRDTVKQTASMAHSLAASALPWVLADDVAGLQESVQAFHAYPEVSYAMVVSPGGKVLSHSDATKIGQFVSDEQSVSLLNGPHEDRVLADNESVIDIAVPIKIAKRDVGWARIGAGRKESSENLRTLILNSAVFLLFATVSSFAAALLIAKQLGRRISALVQVAENVQAGNFSTRVHIPGGEDEISRLGNSLNKMLDALSQNEIDLRKASLYTRSLIEASLDPLVTISPEGKITDVNEATERVTGRRRTELVGTDFSDYFTEPDRARAGYQEVFLKGFVTDYPLALRHSDGHITDVLYNASVYRTGAGAVLGVFAAARDVTERNKAEAALRENQALLQATLNILPVGVWVMGADGNIIFSNDTAKQIWVGVRYVGIDQLGEYKGWRVDNGKLVGAHEWAGARALEKGETTLGEEIEIECFDGTHKVILDSAVPLRDSDGTIRRAVTVNQDITERKRSEETLRRSEASLAEAQRMAHLGNWNLDLVNNVLTWSDEIYRIFEIDPEKFGASYEAFLDAIHPEDREMVNNAFTESVRNKTPYDIVHRLLMKDGRMKYVNEKCETYYAEDGKPLRSIGTVHDITERKLAEDEIKALNRELEQRVVARTAQLEAANKELESFSYSVSHDLRTPLRAIDGFSRILLDDYAGKLDEEGRRLLDVVRENTVKMGQLIDDILKFSRAGRLEINFSEIDMEGLAREIYEELRPSAAGHDMQVEIGHIPPARGDRAMMRQVLVNLISNAIKFTRTREPAKIKVDAYAEKGETVYFVQDNGAGFDMRYVDRLFGVFQRLHAESEFEGTGIGLAIVKRIITRHGGRVWAQGNLNEGATIYFALPAGASPGG